MNLLLDTQALLWFLLDDQRLSRSGRLKITTTEDPIFVSPASLWEIGIKISLGKYSLPQSFQTFWEEQLQINDFILLPVSISHTARIVEMPFYHRDPFDRLIIAQALVEDMPVVSSEVVFEHYGVKRIW